MIVCEMRVEKSQWLASLLIELSRNACLIDNEARGRNRRGRGGERLGGLIPLSEELLRVLVVGHGAERQEGKDPKTQEAPHGCWNALRCVAP